MPADLIGINAQNGLLSGTLPTYRIGHVATIDCPLYHERSMHTAQGVYDFTSMTSLRAALDLMGPGRSIFYVHIGTPSYNKQTQNNIVGPYSGTGEMSYPLSMSDESDYITQLITQFRPKFFQPGNELLDIGTGYWLMTADAGTDVMTLSSNAGAGARPFPSFAASTGSTSAVFFTTTGTLPGGLSINTLYYTRSAISLASPTSQIAATAGGAAIDITDTGTGVHTMWRKQIFNWYTLAQAVDRTYYNRIAVKAADSSCIFTTPAFYDPVAFAEFLDATGPVSGVRGRDIAYDALAIHTYGEYPNLRSGGMDEVTLAQGGIFAMTAIAVARGMSATIPVCISEYAPGSSSTNVRTVQFLAGTAASRRQYAARGMLAAARNPRVLIKSAFSHETAGNLFGDMNEVGGSGAGIDDAYGYVAGKTLLAGAGYTVDGVEQGALSDGTNYSV